MSARKMLLVDAEAAKDAARGLEILQLPHIWSSVIRALKPLLEGGEAIDVSTEYDSYLGDVRLFARDVVAERDALRAEVEQLREYLHLALNALEALMSSDASMPSHEDTLVDAESLLRRHGR